MAATEGSVCPSIVLALGSPPSLIHCDSTETLPRAVAVKDVLGERPTFGCRGHGVNICLSGVSLRWRQPLFCWAFTAVRCEPVRAAGGAVALVVLWTV